MKKNKYIDSSSFFFGVIIGMIIIASIFRYKYPYIIKVEALKNKIKENYIEEVTDEQLNEGIYDGLVKSVDDFYTAYLDKEALKEDDKMSTGEYAGVGIGYIYDEKEENLKILDVFEGSPAYQKGIIKNDRIIEINNISLKNKNEDEILKLISGDIDTTINIKIKRNDEIIEKELTRKKVNVETVKSKILNDNVGYFKIRYFDLNTAEEFTTQFNSMKKEIDFLIIDLRDNPGGIVSSAEGIADLFLKEKTIMYTESKNGSRDYSKADSDFVDKKIYLLANENTASSSEILISALRDNEKATLIGEQTYGKGIMQTLFPFKDETAIKITVAKIYTPDGITIHKKGIKPDVFYDKDDIVEEVSKMIKKK